MSTVPTYTFMRTQKNVAEQLKLADFADKSLLILDDDDPLREGLLEPWRRRDFKLKRLNQ